MRLKERIEQELHLPTRIRLGPPGSLEVFADGQKVYSKKQTGRLPTVEEVVALLRSRKSA